MSDYEESIDNDTLQLLANEVDVWLEYWDHEETELGDLIRRRNKILEIEQETEKELGLAHFTEEAQVKIAEKIQKLRTEDEDEDEYDWSTIMTLILEIEERRNCTPDKISCFYFDDEENTRYIEKCSQISAVYEKHRNIREQNQFPVGYEKLKEMGYPKSSIIELFYEGTKNWNNMSKKHLTAMREQISFLKN